MVSVKQTTHEFSRDPSTDFFNTGMFIFAGVCFVLAATTGIVSGLTAIYPRVLDALPFQRVQPLHMLFSLVGAIVGLLAMVGTLNVRLTGKSSGWVAPLVSALLAAFTLLATISVVDGWGSGREYTSWHPALTPLLITAIGISGYDLLRRFTTLSATVPESLWLVCMGYAFMVFGLLESLLWLWPWVRLDSVRDLTVQWQGLDLLFAGMNTALYGAASMLIGQRQTLRGPLLYVVAAFSVLFTFGHHHYASPQPEFLKSLAVLASLLAIVSFLRHLRASKAGGDKIAVENEPVWTYPMSAVQLWTLVATGSGILLAIPYINTLLHGTYAVVIHAMGSMIGVNFMIVVAGGLALIAAPMSRWRVRRGVQLVSSALIGLWCYLGALGIYEGISRTNTDLLVLSQQVRPLLYGFVLIGGVLLVGIAMLCWELIAAGRSAAQVHVRRRGLSSGEVLESDRVDRGHQAIDV